MKNVVFGLQIKPRWKIQKQISRKKFEPIGRNSFARIIGKKAASRVCCLTSLPSSFSSPIFSRKNWAKATALKCRWAINFIQHENRRRRNFAGHQTLEGSRHISESYFVRRQIVTLIGVFVCSASGASDTLNIIRARRRRIAKQNFLQIADVNPHFKSRRAAQKIDAIGAKFVFDTFRQIFVDLCCVFFRFRVSKIVARRLRQPNAQLNSLLRLKKVFRPNFRRNILCADRYFRRINRDKIAAVTNETVSV